MKKRFTKILSVVLAMLMLCTAVSLTAGAENAAFTEGYYTYEIWNPGKYGHAEITDVDECISGDVVLPSNLGGYPVENISWDALENCLSITSITIPASMDYFGAELPSNVSAIYVAENHPEYSSEDGVLYSKNGTMLCQYPPAKKDTSFVVLDGVIEISFDETFSSCTFLESIAISDSVAYIGAFAFSGCTSLTDVYYCGSEEDWNAITIDPTENEYLLNANIHFNTCLHPKEDNDDSDNCSHMCHKTGFVGFIWKIINLLQRIFGTGKYCDCGASHY